MPEISRRAGAPEKRLAGQPESFVGPHLELLCKLVPWLEFPWVHFINEDPGLHRRVVRHDRPRLCLIRNVQ